MSKQIEALKLALEWIEDAVVVLSHTSSSVQGGVGAEAEGVGGCSVKVVAAIREALAEQPTQQQEPIRVPVTDNTYGYAKSLAEAIFKQHFASDEHYASGRIVWGVNDTVIGILTQIDNMVADMVRRPAQQQEPVAWTDLLKKADEIVRGKIVWKRFIDGTPLANDIAVWMADFAQQHTSPPASKPWVGLTRDERMSIINGLIGQDLVYAFDAVEAKLREKNA